MHCPSEDVLVDLVEGRLDADELGRFHGHVDSCPECRLVVAALARSHPSSPPPFDPAEGQTISHYRLAERLGRGGMGVVYAALDTRLRRRVALKFVASHLAGDSQATARLKREARAASALEHANVGQIYDVGEHEGALFLAMPLYEGETLRQRLDRGALPPREAAALLVQIADGLEAAHAAGVIHRDIKPSNIMLGSDGVRILDFGLAKLAQPDTLVTTSGQMVGTIAYMAPEQHLRGEVDARADLWAVGVTAYEMLAGAPPFPGASPLEVLHAATTREPPPLRDRIGADLEAIVFKCLEKEPERRYPGARELAADLRSWLAGEAISARPIGRAVRLGRQARRHRLALLLLSAAALALVAVAVAGIKMRRDAQLRVERAERLGQATQRIRSQMHSAYLLPLHDTRPERREVEAEMSAIADEMKRSGDNAGGMAEYALGWGALAMGRAGEARPHLEAAYRDGQRGPEAAWALAISLERIYVDEAAEARQLPTGERDKRMATLKRELREPMLGYLAQARGAPQLPVGAVDVVMAVEEHRYEEAIAKAEEIFKQRPSEYEMGVMAERALMEQANETWAHGDTPKALALWQRAEETLQRVAAVARSDDHVLTKEAELLLEESYDRFTVGGSAGGDELYRRIFEICDQAAQAAPDSTRPDEIRANVLYRQANDQMEHGRDGQPLLNRVVEISLSVEARNPKGWRGYLSHGSALVDLGYLVAQKDEDPSADFEAALVPLKQARALHEDEEIPTQMGMAHAYRALYLARTGGDPLPDWDATLALSRDAVTRDPDKVDTFNDLGVTFAERAVWELEHGIDPSASITQGVAALETTIRMAPKYVGARSNRAALMSVKARHQMVLGGDPASELRAAIQDGEQDVALATSAASVRSDVALAYRVAAWIDWRQGRDPSPALSRGRAQAAAAIALNGEEAEPRLERVRMELFAAEHARGGKPALTQAESDLHVVLAATPHLAEANMLQGDLRRFQAEHGDAAACDGGRAALDDAVSRDPRFARAWSVRSRLEKACGGDGRDAHDRALALDRFVDGDY